MKFSANLGFLWKDRPLPEAIRAAAAAGFDAVECHWPYDTPTAQVTTALAETDLPMLGLNTRRGNAEQGENGLAALPGRAPEARAAIDEAIAYAAAIGARHVHVMAGIATGEAARTTFTENLRHACTAAAPHGITILIEPLNSHDAPGYFLSTTAQALEIIETVRAVNLKLMFDCYHVQLMEGDPTRRLQTLLPHIGHIQFASVPDRGPPDCGDMTFVNLFETISSLGWTAPLGAEYRPPGPTEATLGWLSAFRT
ncbi:isomerase, partial [Roseovarius sp. HI0049]